LLPEDGDIVDEVNLALLGEALALAYRRAAETVARLRPDGWDVNLSGSVVWCSHSSVTSRVEAELRLAAIGVDLRCVQFCD
jgi:hypothetical protein